MESIQKERKPYNPYHLAGGHAAESLPDKKTIAVFKCYCNHTDFMGGSVSISLPTVMRETGYSYRAVCYADAVLASLGRITKKSRGIGGQRGGRQSSITTVYCTAEELQKAGANDENFFSRGGKAGLFKVQTQTIQSAKRIYSKRKQDGFKVQRDALEPLKSEPFLPQPIKAEPFKVENPEKSKPKEDRNSLPQGKKEEPTPTPGAQDNTSPAGTKTRRGARPAPPPVELLEPRVVEKMVKLGFPALVIAQIQKMRDWSKALNNTTNVLSSYETLCNKPNDFADRMFKMWMPKRILTAGGMGDDCYDQGWEESLVAKNAVPKEIRIREEAVSWFCNSCDDEKRHTICEFSRKHAKTYFDAIKVEENKKLIAAAYLADLEDRRREEHERVMKQCRESAARKAALEQERAAHQAYLDKAAPRVEKEPAKDYLDEVLS